MIKKLVSFAFCLALVTPAMAIDVADIEWETNNDDPPIGDPAALQGGSFKNWISSYPLTFRLVGPDSNDAFAGWNRSQTQDFTLVRQHPTTDNYIPCMATHWKVMDDHKTIYYKLDPDARWSDGEKITADDYVFTLEMCRSEHIVDPFYNNYFTENYDTVEAVDEYTLKIVGAKESWRPLYTYNLWPMPRHIHKLDENWVKNYNLKPEVGAGPYTITDRDEGSRVVFSKVENWWGKDKHYFQGMYNVDKVELMVILDSNKAFDHFRKGDISYYRVTSAKMWAEDTDIDAVKMGWAHKKRIFIDYPQGIYGMAMNLEKPIFHNKDFRKAIQYAFDFDEVNDNLMYGAYYRMVSNFEGTIYQNKSLKPYGFDPKKCREHLTAAGYTKRDKDGFFVNEKTGQRASFSFTYGQPSLTRHFTVVKQKYERLGIEMKLNVLEAGTAFQRGLERQFEVCLMSRTTNMYPGPHQYYHSEFKKSKNNNNVWYYGNDKTDALIDIYRFDMNADNRLEAMHELDAILQDDAFYVPFWQAPFVRFIHWDYLQFPEFYWPRRFEQLTDWQIFWVDESKKQALAAAMDSKKNLGQDTAVDIDPYGVKAAMEKSMSSLGE